MLVLSRKVGESIIIGENITVTVLKIHGSHVRLGFVAPAEVGICRQEIWIDAENGEDLQIAKECHVK